MDEIDQKPSVETPEGGAGEDRKPELTPEQILGIKKRNFTKLAKELGVELPGNEERVENKKQEKTGFDYSEKAFLKVSGVPNEDFDFVHEVMSSTGKSLDEILETKWFQNELKERQELRKTADATPTGSKRSASSAKDTVEYYLAKGGLPDDLELAAKVIQARKGQESDNSPFSSHPVVR